MESFSTFTFDSAKILDTTIRSADERPLMYTTTTTGDSAEKRTALAGAQGSRDAAIDWKQDTFSIGYATRAVGELRTKRTLFSSSRYWIWFESEECKVKYENNAWTVLSYSGSLLAEFTPNKYTKRGGRNALPVLRLAPSVRDEDERRFIILVLLYSETKRLDGRKRVSSSTMWR
ncbi:hypothetical protein FB451DRAFT_1554746 [Mycena latifolia]|nr:hypothetical protein FB451DRAFT_1554746 [Mycena latifolia]